MTLAHHTSVSASVLFIKGASAGLCWPCKHLNMVSVTLCCHICPSAVLCCPTFQASIERVSVRSDGSPPHGSAIDFLTGSVTLSLYTVTAST